MNKQFVKNVYEKTPRGIKKLFSKSEIQIAYTNFVKDLKAFYAYE